jgi:hypothetical protein
VDIRGNDVDEYTIETNRPIDSVYIYSSSSPSKQQSVASSYRQRRNYRSGQRSVGDASSRTPSSVVTGVVDGSVGGILDSLGLSRNSARKRDSEDNGDDEDDSFPVRATTREIYGRGRAGRPRSSSSKGFAGSQMHLRAAVVLFFLLSMLYGAFQWISMAKSSSQLGRSKRLKVRSSSHDSAFSEGEDRPVHKALMSRVAAMSPSKVNEKLAKVLKKDEGPEEYLDSQKKKKIDADKDLEAEDNGPSDKLEAIEKEEKETKIELSPAVKSGLAQVFSKDPNHKDIPVLWYIPRSGGGMVKNVLSNCKDLVVASEVGGTVANKEDVDKIEVIEVNGHKFINVDTTTEKGLIKAKALGLASSGLVNLVVSPRLQQAASLFSPSKKGRAFAFLRHPVERAVSMFYFLQKHKVAAVANMELEEYCKSPHVENNWMVRILSNKMTGDVGEADLEMAQNLLKEKVIIGLLDQKLESMKRFEYHFGWKYTENPERQSACRTRILVGDYRTNESAKSKIKEGAQAWSLLMWQNKLDMKLYKYAKSLFLQQGAELFSDMP